MGFIKDKQKQKENEGNKPIFKIISAASLANKQYYLLVNSFNYINHKFSLNVCYLPFLLAASTVSLVKRGFKYLSSKLLNFSSSSITKTTSFTSGEPMAPYFVEGTSSIYR
jgi:hypothetical protein